jgi:GTPase SAR1 family protein
MLVGNGAAGKTTLVRRLMHGTFNASEVFLTDGIEMHDITIGDVDFRVLDCAGQKDYALTHRLFIGGIVLAVHRPRSEELETFKANLQMIFDADPRAPIIIVTTYADEQTSLSESTIQQLRAKFPTIVAVYAVDSSSGKVIDALKELLHQTASSMPDVNRQVSRRILAFMNRLKTLRDDTTVFSVTANEFEKLGREAGIDDDDDDVIDLSKQLFKMCGEIYVLSDGSVVLRPQELAEVLACVFTTITSKQVKLGAVMTGFLRHSDAVFESIWGGGKYDAKFWSFSRNTDGGLPPFLQLVYDALLAVPMYGPDGALLDASLIPGLLPDKPIGLGPGDQLDSLFPSEFKVAQSNQPDLEIHFKCPIPDRFMPLFIAKAHHYCTAGGFWRTGALLANKKADEMFPDLRGSYAIVSVSGSPSNVLTIMCSGRNPSARSMVLPIIQGLISDHFPSLQDRDDMFLRPG